MVFGQVWKKSNEPDFDSGFETDDDTETSTPENRSASEVIEHEVTNTPKKHRRSQKDLIYRFPSRATRRK